MNKKRFIIGAIIIACVFAIVSYPRKVVLRLGFFAGSNWDVPSSENYKVIDNAIERFEKENPNITIEYDSGILRSDYSEWLSEQIIQGTAPDVFVILGEDFNMLSSLDALKNLDNYIDSDSNFDEDEFYKSSLGAGVFQDNQYALPFESNPQVMLVNKTLLQKEGIAIPNNDWTIEDFYKICEAVTKDSSGDGIIDQYGSYNYDWLDSIYGYGATLFDEDGLECYLANDEIKDAIQFVQKLNGLNKQHYISSEEFDNGQVAFSPMTFAQYRAYKPYPWKIKKYSVFEWDCIKMPSLTQEQNSSKMSSLLMGISSNTKHSKESWEFLKMLTYDEQTQAELFKYSQGASPLKSITKVSDIEEIDDNNLAASEINLSLLNEVMETTTNYHQFKKYESALKLVDTRVNQMIQKEEDLDLGLMELQKEINQFLND